LISLLLKLVARLPLRIIHAFGAASGVLVFWMSSTYRRRLKENLLASGIENARALIHPAARETGKAALELAALWFAPSARVQSWLRSDTWPVVERAHARGKGLIVMTPHLGGFEAAAFFIAQHLAMTVMYRPPKLRWLELPMLQGRGRFGARVVPANMQGVRAFYRAVKRGEIVGLLPDQTPGVGDGVWADFFGRPAYTMTLVSRLHESTGAPLIIVCAERLPMGAGFHIRFEEINATTFNEAALNRAVEAVVRRCPEQYLWGYNRYKVPAGAMPP
jgi:KDO2-lipid IV(A) lauroyltransferase